MDTTITIELNCRELELAASESAAAVVMVAGTSSVLQAATGCPPFGHDQFATILCELCCIKAKKNIQRPSWKKRLAWGLQGFGCFVFFVYFRLCSENFFCIFLKTSNNNNNKANGIKRQAAIKNNRRLSANQPRREGSRQTERQTAFSYTFYIIRKSEGWKE